jgi:hypothetical protein
MKNRLTHITRFLVMVVMVLIGCYISLTAGRTAGAGSYYKAAPPLPTLRGEAAIEHLKQTGLYHSLSPALAIYPTFRQQQKLVGAGIVTNDLFGYSVAISGETIVVGEAEGVGAYVFAPAISRRLQRGVPKFE